MAGTRVVSGVILKPNGGPWAFAQVRFRNLDDTYTIAPDRTYPEDTVTAVADETGAFSITLASGLAVAYRVTLPDNTNSFDIVVPDGGATTLEALRAANEEIPEPLGNIEAAILGILGSPGNQDVIDHANITNRGTYTHTAIDNHLDATEDVHGATGAVVGLGNVQTLVNKTLGGGTKVALGSDATGDVWYRDAGGNLTRRGIGSNGQVLTVVSGLPAWAASSGGGGGGGDIEVQENNVSVVAVATALDFDGAHFNVTDGGSGRAVVELANPGGGGGGGGGSGSDSVLWSGAIKVTVGDAASTQALDAGTRAYVEVPFACTLTGWSLLASPAADVTLDVWRQAFADGLPTNAQRIAGTEKPLVSGGTHNRDDDLTTWATSIAAGDILGIEIEANDDAVYVELTLHYQRVVVAQYTATDARDHVGAILADTDSVLLAYDDETPEITAEVQYAGTGSAGTAARSDHDHDADYAALGHDHAAADVTDFAEAAQDAVGGILTDSATVDFTYSDGTPSITAGVIDNTSTQKVRVSKGGSLVGTRRQINLIEGANVVLTVADDAGNDRVNVTVASSGGGEGGGGSLIVKSGGDSVGTATALDFDADGFAVADEGGGSITVAPAFGTGAGQVAEGDHGHASGDVSDFAEAAQDAVGGILADSDSVDFTYTDETPEITATVKYGGSGGLYGTAATAARSDHDHDVLEMNGFAEGVRDVVGVTLQAGTGLSKSVSDGLDTTTLSADIGTGGTQVAAGNHTHASATAAISDFNEAAQDAIGNILVDSGSVDFAYNDAVPSVTAAVKYGGTGAAETAARSDHTHSYGATATGAFKFCVGDPTGSPITTGTKGFIYAPFGCTITGWALIADASTTTTLDVWLQAYASGVPSDAERIAGSEKPALSAAQAGRDLSLSSWTVTVAAGDLIGVEVEANNNAKWVELSIMYSRTLSVA